MDKIKRAKKLVGFGTDKSLAVFEELADIAEELEQVNEVFADVDIDALEKIKGEKGDKGDMGEQGEKGAIGDKGDKGDKGEKGDRGNDGLDGLDGANGKDGLNGKDGINGKDGSPDTGEIIVDKINALKITPDKQIDASHIKGLNELHQLVGEYGKRITFIGAGYSGVKSITAGAGVTITRSGANNDFVISYSGGVAKRVTSITTSATPTPNADTMDGYSITALAEAATFGAPTGTPSNMQTLIIRIKDNGTARALTWNAAYAPCGIALPSTTILSKILVLGFMYNTDNNLNKWQLVASAQEA